MEGQGRKKRRKKNIRKYKFKKRKFNFLYTLDVTGIKINHTHIFGEVNEKQNPECS